MPIFLRAAAACSVFNLSAAVFAAAAAALAAAIAAALSSFAF